MDPTKLPDGFGNLNTKVRAATELLKEARDYCRGRQHEYHAESGNCAFDKQVRDAHVDRMMKFHWLANDLDRLIKILQRDGVQAVESLSGFIQFGHLVKSEVAS